MNCFYLGRISNVVGRYEDGNRSSVSIKYWYCGQVQYKLLPQVATRFVQSVINL